MVFYFVHYNKLKRLQKCVQYLFLYIFNEDLTHITSNSRLLILDWYGGITNSEPELIKHDDENW